MAVTGKYDFAGIKKWGAKGLLLALSTVPYLGAALKISIIHNIADAALEMFCNWLANKGLVVLNVGAITVQGTWDQRAFDKAMEDGLRAAEIGRGKLTPEQIKAIDDAVIKAARKFIVIAKH